jgi:thiamine biosynthesis lipoprotein
MHINPIKIKTLAGICAGILLFVLCSSTSRNPVKSYQTFVSDYENVLGTSAQVKISAASATEAIVAETAALNEIDRLDHILSGYNQQSEFSRWMQASSKPTVVSADLFKVLSLFDEWRTRSNGALDASAEVIAKLWKDAAKRNQIPSQSEIAAAVSMVKQQHYKLDAAARTAQRLDNAPLMLNSFAKSYIIAKAADAALASGGISAIVLNIGGDIVIRGAHTEQVQISNPKADAENDAPLSGVLLSNKAIATSGNYRRGELINGKWYSHIVDPRSGLPTDKVISSTVVADNATDAGALATAFSVLSPAESAKLAVTIPGAEYMLITSDGQRIQSSGWKALEVVAAKPVAANVATAKGKTWDTNYELLINLELAQIEGFRVHRPYVAVWVVDKNKKPVRNIALWYNKTRYLDDMHAWYNTYYQTFMDANSNVSSTTSATRSPGKYTLKWDGKDDKGDLVPAGSYTIYIEAAREHGTYQLIDQEMDFTGKPKQISLPANTELSAASLDYRKKAKDVR